MHTHYYGDRAGPVSGENVAAETIAKKIKAGDDTVYVIPQDKALGDATNWSNVADINETTAEALRHAGLSGEKIGRTVVSGHSAGGRAIVSGIKDGQTLKADELVLQDALYEGIKGPGAHTALKKHLPATAKDIGTVTIVGSQEESTAPARSKELADLLKKAGRNVTILPRTPTHAGAGGVLEAPKQPPQQGDHFVR